MRTAACVVLAGLLTSACFAQDPEFVREWERIQRDRPSDPAWRARIAPASEPGTPLVIHGRVFQSDGVTPAAGVTVFAYHTDRTGVYNISGARGWRLRGWARTDRDGRFEFQTIRPAEYPARTVPAHVHLAIYAPDLPRRWTPELQFADDVLLRESDRRRSAALGKFGWIRDVTARDGTQHVDFNVRISDEGRF